METEISTTISGPKICYLDFIKEIKKLDYINLLMKLQEFSVLMRNQSAVNINIEFEFHIIPKIKHKILISRHCISFLSKESILNCKKSTIKSSDLDLIKLTHMYETIKIDLDEINSRSRDSWLWVLRATNLQHFYMRTPNMVIARYYFIFSKVLKNTEFADTLNKTVKLDILNIIKIGYCITALLIQNKSFTKERLINTSDSYLKKLLSNKNVNNFIKLFSTDQIMFRQETKKFKTRNYLLKKYEFNPLKRFPIIKTDSSNDNEKYIIPSLGDFIYSFSEGLYYVLLDKLDKDNKKTLFSQFGSIFEEYIGSLIRSYNIDLLSRCKLHSESEYKVDKFLWKSADWLLVSNDHIFQIECKKRKPDQYSRAGMNIKNQGINNLISNISIELDKLMDKGTHLKNNLLSDIKYNGQIIINIIVFLDEMFGINQYARQRIITEMKKPSNNFYILGCHEFEVLCQLCRNRNAGIYQCLSSLEKDNVYEIDFLNEIFSHFLESIKHN